MFKSLKKMFRTAADTYANPGAGVTVYTTPDSLLDFYRLDGAFAPFFRRKAEGDKPSQRRLWIWGGGTASHQTRLTLRRSGRHSTCTDC